MGQGERWVVFQEGPRRRWGGDLRRAFVFSELATRTGATVVSSWSPPVVRRALRRSGAGRWLWSRRQPVRVASAELLTSVSVDEARGSVDLFALDVHDDPIAQRSALGLGPADEALVRRWHDNLSAFQWLVAPSETFADFAGLDPARRIIVPNGTDTRHIRPLPFPDQPAVGFVSTAAPARGIEQLIETARLLRSDGHAIRLLLWLVAASEDGRIYLDALTAACRGDDWIEIGSAPYERLGSELARATVLVVPHPPGDYYDAALPVKLFDSMAAGRPIVVTPRTETAAVVTGAGCGRVSTGDRPDDLAAAVGPLLADARLAERLGAMGREAAERDYDWQVLGGRVADRLLREAAVP